MTNNLKAPQNNIISLCKVGSSIITNLDMSHMRSDLFKTIYKSNVSLQAISSATVEKTEKQNRGGKNLSF